jgi:hypothetical protein
LLGVIVTVLLQWQHRPPHVEIALLVDIEIAVLKQRSFDI